MPFPWSTRPSSPRPASPYRARSFAIVVGAAWGLVSFASTGCASRSMRVSVQGLVEDVEAGDRAAVTRRTFDTQVVTPLGQSVDIRSQGAAGGALVLRLTSAVVDAGTALLELEVVRIDQGSELVLARPRVKAPLGGRTVAEARATDDDLLLRYFRFALEPSLEP